MKYVLIDPEDVINALTDNSKVKYAVMDARYGMKEGVYNLDETISVNGFIHLLNCENVMFFEVVNEED